MRITFMSSLNAISNDQLGNGVAGWGEGEALLRPSPLLSTARFWTDTSRRREEFSFTSDICYMGQSYRFYGCNLLVKGLE